MPEFFVRVSLCVLFGACSSRDNNDRLDAPGLEDGGDASTDGSADGSRDGPDDGPDRPDDVLVWAHSHDTLFAFDPYENTVEEVGRFRFLTGVQAPSMTDLAVTEDGTVYTCSNASLFRVNTDNALVEWVSNFSSGGPFNAMTFLPRGVLEDDRETLIGAAAGSYFRIELSSGNSVLVGQYSDGFVSSGDIVSVKDAGTFATVKQGDIEVDGDLLVELNPETGEVTPIGTGTGFDNLFGLGFWRSRFFGFSSAGQLVEIDIETGVGELAEAETGTDEFWGAGVTTLAPVGPF